MPTIIEHFESRSSKESEKPTSELTYRVFGTEDDATVNALVAGAVPATYQGRSLQSWSKQHVGGGVWEISLQYGTAEPPEGNVTWAFDLSADSVHIQQSRQTIARYAPAGETAPDFKGAIGYDGESVQGCDIVVPTYKWTETYYPPLESLTIAYADLVYGLVGKTNSTAFRNKAVGEVLLIGAQGGRKTKKKGKSRSIFRPSPTSPG